jgi:hypothetical protein
VTGNYFIPHFFSTLWVRSINNAIEECQALEKTIGVDKALFSPAGKIEMENFTMIFSIFQDKEPNPESAVARLILVVSEAFILIPPPTPSLRHRSYRFY